MSDTQPTAPRRRGILSRIGARLRSIAMATRSATAARPLPRTANEPMRQAAPSGLPPTATFGDDARSFRAADQVQPQPWLVAGRMPAPGGNEPVPQRPWVPVRGPEGLPAGIRDSAGPDNAAIRGHREDALARLEGRASTPTAARSGAVRFLSERAARREEAARAGVQAGAAPAPADAAWVRRNRAAALDALEGAGTAPMSSRFSSDSDRSSTLSDMSRFHGSQASSATRVGDHPDEHAQSGVITVFADPSILTHSSAAHGDRASSSFSQASRLHEEPDSAPSVAESEETMFSLGGVEPNHPYHHYKQETVTPEFHEQEHARIATAMKLRAVKPTLITISRQYDHRSRGGSQGR